MSETIKSAIKTQFFLTQNAFKDIIITLLIMKIYQGHPMLYRTLIASASLFLGACGSSGGGTAENATPGDTAEEISSCTVIMSGITLKDGESCVLLQEDADLFGITPGEATCSAGKIKLNSLVSNESLSLNGLKISCIKDQ